MCPRAFAGRTGLHHPAHDLRSSHVGKTVDAINDPSYALVHCPAAVDQDCLSGNEIAFV